MGPPLPPPVVSDKTRFNRAGRTAPPLAQRPTVPPPVVVKQSTLVIRGSNGSQWNIVFGDGNRLSIVDLTDYKLHVDIGHRVFDLTGILPDAIGIDINGAGSFSIASVVYGANIVWHTRGENNNLIPELHLYKGLNAGLGLATLTTPMDISGSASLLLAWASRYDDKGNKTPAPNSWVSNGFNWTGYFYTVALSIPTPWGFNAVGAYFTSDKRLVRTTNTVWWGISIGISKSLSPTAKMPSQFWDIAKWLRNNSSLNFSRTEYYLVFGNGKDYVLNREGDPTKDVSGWQPLINQNDYNK